jgi:hypothetical protein
MQAVKELPENYKNIGVIDISKKRTLLLVSLLGLVLMCGFSFLFTWALSLLRPMQFNTEPMNHPFGLDNVYLATLGLVILSVGMLLLHEALHGICFWIFTGSQPHFAFKAYYAYASIPGWYLPKVQYLVSALSPFLFITIVGLILLATLPATWFIPLLFVIVMNAAGSVGDLVVAAWLLGRHKGVLAQDRGDAVSLFEPLLEE